MSAVLAVPYQHPITRLERVINATAALDDEQSSLFADLFRLNKSEEQVCEERGISRQTLEEQKAQMMRNLVAASR